MTRSATSPANEGVRRIGSLPGQLAHQLAAVAGATFGSVFFVKTGDGEVPTRKSAEPVVVRKRESGRWVR